MASLDLNTYEGDVRLGFEDNQGCLYIVGNDLERDGGLETAVLISLYTDKRATLEEAGQDHASDLHGWWADQTFPVAESIGSLRWLLEPSKITIETLAQLQEYDKQALQWMIDDGVASDVIVKVTRVDTYTVKEIIQVVRPDKSGENVFTYFFNWETQIVRRG